MDVDKGEIVLPKGIVVKYEIDENSCWNITNRRITSRGDIPCKVKFNGKKYYSIVRLVYDTLIKESKDMSFIKHTCRNRKCINPNHLREEFKGFWRNKEVGNIYNRFTVIEFDGDISEDSRYVTCRCECGNVLRVNIDNLRLGKTKSCGCYRDEFVSENSTKHGKSGTRIFRIYTKMKERCYSPNCERYKNYGGRGIKICDEWLNDFMNFYNWAIENGYDEMLSIERVNVDGNYEPSNCTWIKIDEQHLNKQNTIWIEHNGEKQQLTKLLREYSVDLNVMMVKRRIFEFGFSFEDSIKNYTKREVSLLRFKYKLMNSNKGNDKLSIQELSDIVNISTHTLNKKYINKSDFNDMLKELNIEVYK